MRLTFALAALLFGTLAVVLSGFESLLLLGVALPVLFMSVLWEAQAVMMYGQLARKEPSETFEQSGGAESGLCE